MRQSRASSFLRAVAKLDNSLSVGRPVRRFSLRWGAYVQLAERLPKRPNSCLTLLPTRKNGFLFFLVTKRLPKPHYGLGTLANTKLFQEMWYFKVNSWNACQNQTFGLERLPNDEFWFGSQVKILIVIHEALTLLFLPVSCHHTRPRSARTHLAALAGAKNVALDADLPCVARLHIWQWQKRSFGMRLPVLISFWHALPHQTRYLFIFFFLHAL